MLKKLLASFDRCYDRYFGSESDVIASLDRDNDRLHMENSRLKLSVKRRDETIQEIREALDGYDLTLAAEGKTEPASGPGMI